jgi:hypothetical protein
MPGNNCWEGGDKPIGFKILPTPTLDGFLVGSLAARRLHAIALSTLSDFSGGFHLPVKEATEKLGLPGESDLGNWLSKARRLKENSPGIPP